MALRPLRTDTTRGRPSAPTSKPARHARGRESSREQGFAQWIETSVLLPSQDRRTLHRLVLGERWREFGAVRFDSPVIATRRWSFDGARGAAVLPEDGSTHWIALD